MSNPSDGPFSTSSNNIFDQYPGYDATMSRLPSEVKRQPHFRTNSDLSLRSSAHSSSSHHNPRIGAFPDMSHILSSPLKDPSTRSSSSSSLRQTVALLKGGVFPPGVQRQRLRHDSSSDGSNYGDRDEGDMEEEGYTVEKGGPFESHTPNLDETAKKQADIFSNALDSPSVPTRISSAQGTSRNGSPEKEGSNLAIVEKIEETSNTQSPKIVDAGLEHAREVPTDVPTSPHLTPDRIREAKKMERITSDTSNLSPATEKTLEKILDAEDPNRPRTLKEARALAKERARLRLQAKEGADAASPETFDAPFTSPMMTETSQQEKGKNVESSPTPNIREKSATRSVEAAQRRAENRQRAIPIVTRGKELDHRQEPDTNENKTTWAMADSQSAVGDALEDLSFSSSTATTSTANAIDSTDTSKESFPMMRLEIPPSSKGEGDNESSARSATSFDSAQESLSKSRPVSIQLSSQLAHSESEFPSTNDVDKEESSPDSVVTPILSSTPSTSHKTTTKSTSSAIPVQDSPSLSTFVPHNLPAQQRWTAPNKIARLDVYGKTVPWPAAFNPAAIIEQRRLAPWERARSYAHYCNDLSTTSTGLRVWMEIIQRPIQRTMAEPTTPVKRHFRGGGGTDHSGYAASVRSDATFPVRGDGGRAKELMSSIPATINESQANTLPSNIPYPMLVQQQQPRSSSSSFDEGGNSSSTLASDRSMGLSRPNFFTNLGRKQSNRRTPGSGSITGLSALSSSTSSGALRPRGKGKPTISSPVNMNTSPSLANVMSGMETRAAPTEATQSSPSPHNTLNRSQIQSLNTLGGQAATRIPMGPRSPSKLNFPVAPTIRRESETSVKSNDTDRSTGYTKAHSTGSGSASGSPVVTDYTAYDSKPTLAPIKSSLSYNSVREPKRSPRSAFPVLQAPPMPHRGSVDSNNRSKSSSRRGSHQPIPATPAENEALDKLSDVLPDAERITLLEYLRKAGGNDLVAIGDYLQAQSMMEGKLLLR